MGLPGWGIHTNDHASEMSESHRGGVNGKMNNSDRVGLRIILLHPIYISDMGY